MENDLKNTTEKKAEPAASVQESFAPSAATSVDESAASGALPVEKRTRERNPITGKDEERELSRSERWYNFWTHRVLNFGLNMLISVGFTEQFKYRWKNKEDKLYWTQWEEVSGDNLQKALGWAAPSCDAQWFGESFMNKFALQIPGWVILPIMGVLDWNKRAVLGWMDKIGDKLSPPDAREKKLRAGAYEALDRMPKESLPKFALRLITTRILGWSVFAYATQQTFDLVSHKLGSRKVDEWTGFAAEKVTGLVPYEGEKRAVFQRVADITFQEIISCLLTSTGMAFLWERYRKVYDKAWAGIFGAPEMPKPVAGNSGSTEKRDEAAPETMQQETPPSPQTAPATSRVAPREKTVSRGEGHAAGVLQQAASGSPEMVHA